VYWAASKGCYYFYQPSGQCFLVGTNKFLYYEDTANAVWPLKQVANYKIRNSPVFNKSECEELLLINPLVDTADARISVQQYDLFSSWTGEKPSLVIAANILNFNYFDIPTLRTAIRGLIQCLNGDGYLAIVDNRPDEHGSLFSVSGDQIRLEQSINGGAMTESLALELEV